MKAFLLRHRNWGRDGHALLERARQQGCETGENDAAP